MSLRLDKEHAETLAARAREYLAIAQSCLEELHKGGFDVKIKDDGQPYRTYVDDAVMIEFNENTALEVQANRRVEYTEEV